MRATIRKAINLDTQLRMLGLPEGSVYQANAVDSPDAIRKGSQPFIVLNWGTREPGLTPNRPNNLTVWVYDHTKDYDRVDRMLARLRDIMTALVSQPTRDGWITSVDWSGDGADGWDDVYGCVFRTSSFRVVAS